MRTANIIRKTKETEIKLTLKIEGEGNSKISTGIGLLDHMLELFAFHGLFDLTVEAKGDLKIDIHHTNEDIGICLGQAFKKALADKKGIKRFGFAAVPMEEVIANVVIDISGRPSFKFKKTAAVANAVSDDRQGYSIKDAEHFFESFAKQLGANLNIEAGPLSEDLHTNLEPVFKALGLALDLATQVEPRRKGVPSSKGVID